MSRTWTNEHLIFDGDQYFQDVIEGIEAARERVAYETYIFDDDPLGHLIENSLVQAAERGIKTQLLVDGIGARYWLERRAGTLAAKGVEVRVYHPLRIYENTSRLLRRLGVGANIIDRGRYLFARMNRRNHRKVVIVDNRQAWVGSLNVSASHSARIIGPEFAWRDTAVRVEGPPLANLIAGFDFAYGKSHDLNGRREKQAKLIHLKRHLRSAAVRQNFTLKLRRRGYQEFLRRVARARRRIWITNAYLAPSTPVLKALSRAAQRGVDVRVLVPRKSDVFFMPWVAGSHYPKLLNHDVRIHEYLPQFLHAKSVLIDNWATVGTSNLNGRSLTNDLEVDIVVRKPVNVRKLAHQFEIDLKNSEEIHLEPRNIGERIKQTLASVIGRFLLWLMRDLI